MPGLWSGHKRPWQLRSPFWLYAPCVATVVKELHRERVPPWALLSLNPAFRLGGWVVESKAERYIAFGGTSTMVPTIPFRRGIDSPLRMGEMLLTEGGSFPAVVKPDCGRMSLGVVICENEEELAQYLNTTPVDQVVQPLVDKPYEYSLLFAREPGCQRGEIVDCAERLLPSVRGDGLATVAELIKQRESWQWCVDSLISRVRPDFLTRVPQKEEVVPLLAAASGAFGAIFVDRSNLISDVLTEFVNAIAHKRPGFFVGKLDIKAASPRALIRARNLSVLEINGSWSEPSSLFARDVAYSEAVDRMRLHYRRIVRIAAENWRNRWAT